MLLYLYLTPYYLAAATLPLLTNLGTNLEYEYALLFTWLLILLMPLAGFLAPRRLFPVEDGLWDLRASPEFIWVFIVSPFIPLIPGAILFWTRTCLCSPSGYILWMVLLGYPAWILGHAACYGIIRGRAAAMKKRYLGLITLTTILGIAGFSLIILWIHPQKRINNLIFGFIHGPIYDHWIPLDLGIILVRVSYVFAAALGLFVFWWRRQWTMGLSMIACILGWIGTRTLSLGYPSTHNSLTSLLEVMDSTLKGRGFTLHHSNPHARSPRPKLGTTPNASPTQAKADVDADGETKAAAEEALIYQRKIQVLFRDTQFHMDELSKILKTQKDLPHVHVFVYPSEDQKKLWFGGGSTDVTDVVTPSIHIVVEDFPHPTLRHELVHALASGFGFYGLGFHPNIAFTEGLAIALAPSPGDISLDDGAASLLDSGRIKDVSNLFSIFFWKESGSRAYTVAGSFIRFLIDQYGFASVQALYSGESFEKATQKPAETLIKEWKNKVFSKYNKASLGLYTEALYRQESLFQDRCPHSKKDLEKGKNQGVFARIRQPPGFDPDKDYLTWLISLDPGSIEVRSRMWRQEIKKLAQERFVKYELLEAWIKTLKNARQDPPETIEDIELAIQESDLHRFLNRPDQSMDILKKLDSFIKTKNIGDGLSRFLKVRLRVEEITGSQALLWRSYFAGYSKSIPDKQPLLTDPWLIVYLKLRRGAEIPFTKAQLTQLIVQPLPVDTTLPQHFVREYYRMLGARLMDLEEYETASLAYKRASQEAKSLHQEHLLEMSRRAQYHATLGALKTP